MRNWKENLFVGLLATLGLVGWVIGATSCGPFQAVPQFYVKSGRGGCYEVNLNGPGGLTDITVSKCFPSPKEAQDLVERLNENMEGNWVK